MMPFAPGTLGRAAGGGGGAILRPQDVFQPILFNTAGAGTQLGSGINVARDGGLMIGKHRTLNSEWGWVDTDRGITKSLNSSNDNQEISNAWVSAVNANGFVSGSYWGTGYSAIAYILRFAPKFCVAVRYTGDGVDGRQILHGLGIAPGLIIIKRRDSVSSWPVLSTKLQSVGSLNTTDPFTGSISGAPAANGLPGSDGSASYFNVYAGSSGINAVNASGGLYEALLYAHDPGPDGIIQCGLVAETSGTALVNLGWTPQFLETKCIDQPSDWIIQDAARGFSSTNSRQLFPNSPRAEDTSTGYAYQTATGFALPSFFGAGTRWVFRAIRAPIT